MVHRNADGIFFIVHKDFLRYTGAFFSKHNIGILRIRNICICLMCLCRGHKHIAGSLWILFEKILVTVIDCDVQFIPVIHSRSFQHFIADLKPQRLDQMKSGAGRTAGTANVSGVGRYLRLKKYNIYHTFPLF